MSGVSFIEYKGKKILFIDNRNSTKEQSLKNVFEFDRLLRTQPLKSVLVLHDVTDSATSRESLEKLKEFSSDHVKYVHKNALVGIKGVRSAMLMAYKIFARMKGLNIDEIMKSFNNQDEAKEWLIKD